GPGRHLKASGARRPLSSGPRRSRLSRGAGRGRGRDPPCLTAVAEGEAGRQGRTGRGMITLYRWYVKDKHATWLGAEELRQRAEELRAADVLWVDLEDPTPEEEQLVFQQFFPIHSLSFEDVTRLRRLPDRPPHLPKVEEFPDYLFVIVNPLRQRVAEGLRDGRDPVLADGTAVTQ